MGQSAKQSAGAARGDLSAINEELRQQREQVNAVQKLVEQVHVQLQDMKSQASIAQEERDTRIQQTKEERIAAERAAAEALRHGQDQATSELESVKDALESQLKIVRESAKSKTDLVQNTAQSHIQQAHALAEGQLQLHRVKTQAALERTKRAMDEARGRLLDYQEAEQGFRLKTEEHLRKIEAIQKELAEHVRNRQAEIDQAMKQEIEENVDAGTPL